MEFAIVYTTVNILKLLYSILNTQYSILNTQLWRPAHPSPSWVIPWGSRNSLIQPLSHCVDVCFNFSFQASLVGSLSSAPTWISPGGPLVHTNRDETWMSPLNMASSKVWWYVHCCQPLTSQNSEWMIVRRKCERVNRQKRHTFQSRQCG